MGPLACLDYDIFRPAKRDWGRPHILSISPRVGEMPGRAEGGNDETDPIHTHSQYPIGGMGSSFGSATRMSSVSSVPRS